MVGSADPSTADQCNALRRVKKEGEFPWINKLIMVMLVYINFNSAQHRDNYASLDLKGFVGNTTFGNWSSPICCHMPAATLPFDQGSPPLLSIGK